METIVGKIIGIAITTVTAAAVVIAVTFMVQSPINLSAQSDRLFTVGERVMVAVDCLPITERPCFTEIILILEVRLDGWLRVQGTRKDEWIVNPNRIYAFQREPGGNLAAVQ